MSFFFSSLFTKYEKERIIKWLKWIASVYIAGGIALYFLQDAILFHPVTLKRNHHYNFPQPHKDVSIALSEKTP